MKFLPTVTSKNALRERTRVESLRRAYLELQGAIPSVPPNTKLSKVSEVVSTAYSILGGFGVAKGSYPLRGCVPAHG